MVVNDERHALATHGVHVPKIEKWKTEMIIDFTPAANPHRSEPGTLIQQFAAIGISLYLAERRGTTAETEWQDARAMLIPHARPTIVVSDAPSDLIDGRGDQ